MEPRIDRCVDRTLGLLSRFGARATFFASGWIAERYPEVIRRILQDGHEIANGGYGDITQRSPTREEFRDDLLRAQAMLQAAGAEAPSGYRDPYGIVHEAPVRFLEVLAAEGYRYDASSPELSAREVLEVGVETLTPAGPLQQLEPSSALLLGKRLWIGDLSTVRSFSPGVVRRAFRSFRRDAADHFVLLFRTWELDAEQPVVTALSRGARRCQYARLSSSHDFLAALLDAGGFRTAASLLQPDPVLALSARSESGSAAGVPASAVPAFVRRIAGVTPAAGEQEGFDSVPGGAGAKQTRAGERPVAGDPATGRPRAMPRP